MPPSSSPASSEVPTGAGIDHLVIAGRDLDALASFYRRLGFQVGARNRHDWGTENHIVQLSGAFLELLGLGGGFVAPPPNAPWAPFAGFLSRYLTRRQGLAMLVLRSADATADQQRFEAAGIALGGKPFRFGRKGRRPDGSEVEVAFSLAFAGSPVIEEAGFFVCQQHFPRNFWNPAFQQHTNSARRILGVVMVANRPEEHATFLAAFAGENAVEREGLEVDTGNGRIEVLTRKAFGRAYGEATPSSTAFAAFRIGVREIAATAEALRRGDVPHRKMDGRLLVSLPDTSGCVLSFEPDTTI